MNQPIEDLIFIPLDLPPPPSIDLDKFHDWHREQLPYNKEHNYVAARSNGKESYPWAVSWATWYTTYQSDNPWICDFDKKFPELVEYLSLFPVKQYKSIVFLEQQESREVYLHTDGSQSTGTAPGDWFGLRFYLHNTLGEKLYFVRTKEKYTSRKSTFAGNNEYVDLWPLSDGKKEYARFPEKRCAWMLNNIRAFHGVDVNDVPDPAGSSRITAVLSGIYDREKLKPLISNSLKKYSDYAIWY